jgi:DNA-binding transcriptional MocR family regulator
METIAFARGVPAAEMLPAAELRAALDSALERDSAKILSYGTGFGYQPLRDLLADRHGVTAGQVVITNGSLQGFDFLVDALSSEPGSSGKVWVVEKPTYDRPLLLLQRRGLTIETIDVDSDGAQVDALARLLECGANSALTYLIPTFQNPAGATMTRDRRQMLLSLLENHPHPVLEDDPYGLLWFGGNEPPAPLFSSDRSESVIFSSSMSKTIGPGLRVGYIVLPEPLAARVATIANDTYISANGLGQAAAYEFLKSGAMDANVQRCRDLLEERCDAMCDALDRLLPNVEYIRPGGGYFLWATLPNGMTGDELLPIATEHGVTFVPGSAFGEGCEQNIRLAFSFPSVSDVALGVERLAAAVEALVPAAS